LKAGTKDGHPWKEPVADYQGPRSAGAIAKYALSNVQSCVTKAKASQFETIDSEEGSAILFTDKKTTSDLYKSLSCHFSGRLALYEAHSSDKALVSKFEIKKFPTLIVVGGKAGEKPVVYDGKLKFSAIEEFLIPFAKPAQRASAPPQDDSPPSPPPPAMEKKLHNPNSKEEFDQVCLEKRGLCAIGFLDSYEKDRHQNLLKELDEVLEKHFKNFHIMWIEGPQQFDLYNSLKLGGGFPALSVYSPNKKRVIPYVGGWIAKDINEFLDSVLRGARSEPTEIAAFVKPEPITIEEDEDEKDEKDEL